MKCAEKDRAARELALVVAGRALDAAIDRKVERRDYTSTNLGDTAAFIAEVPEGTSRALVSRAIGELLPEKVGELNLKASEHASKKERDPR